MSLLLFLGIFFLINFLFGIFLERFRIPWIFSALFFGLVLSFFNPWPEITASPELSFLSQLGLYFLLFLIGFELDLTKLKSLSKFIVKSTFLIEFLEAVFVGGLIYLIFKLPIWLSAIIGLSFATVGEAILLPILEELKLVKTKLGQVILGIASFDNLLEIVILILIVSLSPLVLPAGLEEKFAFNSLFGLVIIFLIFFLCWYFLGKLKDETQLFNMPNIITLFPLIFALFFLFLGLSGAFQKELAVLSALLAGLSIRHTFSQARILELEESLKNLIYGLFAPFFFLSVGLETKIHYLWSYFWLILLFVLVAKGTKILASYLSTKSLLGTQQSIYLGIALGVRFSTSLVFLKILLDVGFIKQEVFSVLVGTAIAFKFIIPFLLVYLANRWQLAEQNA